MQNRISACLVIYNEEKYIKRCLDSICDVVDEIIIVHDGQCTDKTLEICRKYTDKIFVCKHNGVAEHHRPFSYSKAQYEWILQIDADEYLSLDLKKNLRFLVSRSNVSAYEFLWPLWDGSKRITLKWPYKRCLYRKSKMSFLGIPQYVVDVKGVIMKSNFILEHRPNYNNFTWEYFKKKSLKRAKNHAQTYLQDFNQIPKFNYHDNNWPLKIKLRRKFPLLLAPLEFLITFTKVLISGAWNNGCIGWKVAIKHGAYRFMVNYYIFKVKTNKH